MTMTPLIERLRNYGVILYEPVQLRGGESSQFYADIKKAYGDPELLAQMGKLTLEALDPNTTCLAASGYGGLPLGVTVSRESGLPLAMVRETEKKHGKKGLIDGYIPNPTDNVSILDDVYTSGSSLLATAKIIRALGAEILGCHVVVARGTTSEFEYPITYLVSSDELK